MPELVAPSHAYRDEYLRALSEFRAEGRHAGEDPQQIARDFTGFLLRKRQEADLAYLLPNRVPASEFWLVEGPQMLGRLSLRHELNEWLLLYAGHIGYEIRPAYRRQGYGKLILKLGLEQARARGLARVLVTCDDTNPGSRKIIEANGGVLENAVDLEGQPEKRLRFWIEFS